MRGPGRAGRRTAPGAGPRRAGCRVEALGGRGNGSRGREAGSAREVHLQAPGFLQGPGGSRGGDPRVRGRSADSPSVGGCLQAVSCNVLDRSPGPWPPQGGCSGPQGPAGDQSQSQGLIRSFPLDFPHQPAQDFRLGERMALGTCEGRGLGTQYDLLGTLGPRWLRRGEPGPCVLSTPVYRTDRDSDRLNPTCQAPRGGWARDQVGVRGPCGAFPSSLRFRRKQLPRGPVVSGQLCHQPSQEKGL